METTAFPIRLDQVFFTRSIVVAIPNHEPSKDAPLAAADNNINVIEIGPDSGQFQVSMTCKMNAEGDSAYPYVIDMECVGVFSADKSLSKEDALRGVTITSHSVLYGAIREAVAWITSRQPHGQVMLGLSVLQGKSSTPPPQKTE